MKRLSLLTAALLMVMTAGCAFAGYEHKAPLNETDYASFLGEGTAKVSGEVTVTLLDGKIVHTGESFVYLVPATPYAAEWYEHYLVGDHKISGLDPRLLRVTRITVVRPDGRFEFSNIPAGTYYLSCTVMPDLPPHRFLWVTLQRSVVKAYATVTVRAGEEVKVTVTRPLS